MLRPDPPSALGNPPPPVAVTLALPDEPPARAGRVVPLGPGNAGVDLAVCRKILVVKLDFIGDWVMTTPFLAGLRAGASQAEITAIVLDRAFALAEPCRLLDRVLAVPAAATGPITFGAADGATLAGFLRDMDHGAFDLALVPRWDTDFNGATRIAALSGARTVIGFSEDCTARKQRDNRGLDRFLDVALRDHRQCHEVEHMLGMLDALGAPRDNRLHLDLTDTDRAAAAAFRGDAARPLLALGPFAAGRRQWPPERTAALAAAVAAGRGMAVAVIGGPENAGEAAAVAALIVAAGVPARSSAGVLGLRENAALIGASTLFVGMDSGPGHVAAALGVPVVTVGAQPVGASAAHPGAPERFAPWAPASRLLVLRPARHAAPCRDGCDAGEPHCILGLEVDDVLPAVRAFADAQGVQR